MSQIEIEQESALWQIPILPDQSAFETFLPQEYIYITLLGLSMVSLYVLLKGKA
jgi:hypothetical protein|tara:strand:+ start:825 stop:986 length:162 start_codon:yes stop_codon:yes gene_type:complete